MKRVLIGAALVLAALVGGLTAVEAHEPSPPAPPTVAAPVAATASAAAVRAAPVPRIRYDATVLRVEDGDTLIVRLRNGQRRHVRVLGIDTHEILFGQHECGGLAGSRSMHRMLPRGAKVLLRADPAQIRVDRYHRLLRYVARASDNLDVGRQQLALGLAEVYVYGDGPYARRAAYEKVERAAQGRRLGIWRWC